MPHLLVRHKIAEYEKWKSEFDKHGATRQAKGSKQGRLFRNANDPNELLILMEWDKMDRAREFAQSDDLRQAMDRAGVADKPDVYFLEEVEKIEK